MDGGHVYHTTLPQLNAVSLLQLLLTSFRGCRLVPDWFPLNHLFVFSEHTIRDMTMFLFLLISCCSSVNATQLCSCQVFLYPVAGWEKGMRLVATNLFGKEMTVSPCSRFCYYILTPDSVIGWRMEEEALWIIGITGCEHWEQGRSTVQVSADITQFVSRI